jgi:hypothetical protein
MQRFWQEIRAGWNDARWGFDVLIALLPLTVAAVFIVDALCGRIQIPARVWMFGYGILAGLFIRVFAMRLWRGWKKRLIADWRRLQTLLQSGRVGHGLSSGVRGGEVRRGPQTHRPGTP